MDRDANTEDRALNRKEIIVLTDGGEKDSAIEEQHLIDQLKASDVQVFFVGLTFELEKEGGVFHRSEKMYAEEFFKKIAAITGGKVFSPDHSKDLGNMVTELTGSMRGQYVIGYYPTRVGNNGEFHKTKVEIVNPERKCTVTTRPGYVETRK